MRFTLSALSLAESTGRRYSYVWPQTEMFKPKLTDLWHFHQEEMPWPDSVELAKTIPYVNKSEDLDKNTHIWHLRGGDPLTVPDGVATWFERFRALVPSDSICEDVRDTFSSLSGTPYVGVSVRAHHQSHAKTRQASPVGWYLNRMSEIAERFPRIKFYISCDSPDVQDEIIRLFPNSVALMDKGSYNSAKGVHASVVDLYLLASSNYLLVPYWSSFPTLAWELSGRRLTMENSQHGREDLDIESFPLAFDPLNPSRRLTLS